MARRRIGAIKSKNPVKFVCAIIAVSFLVVQILSALQIGKVSSTPKPRRKIAGVSEIGKFGEILIGMLPEDLAFTLFLPSEEAFRRDLRLKRNDSNSYAILTRVLGYAAVPRQIGLADLPSGEEKRYESISGFDLHLLKDGKGMTVVNGVVLEKVGLKMGNLMVYIMNGVVMGAEFAQSMEPEEEEEAW